MDQLRRMHTRTLPVTLVDAAFRGKELAMHKAVAGCAVQTSLCRLSADVTHANELKPSTAAN